MAAFCGVCGKPIAGDVRFCGGCGAPTSPAANATPPAAPSPVINAAPAASGTSALKVVLVLFVIAGVGLAAVGTGVYFYGRNKVAQWRKDNGVSSDASGLSVLQAAAAAHHGRSHGGSGTPVLTKEEVSEIILKPVTELEMQGGNDAQYKTATMGYEASIEVERKDDNADAKQSFDAARMVTQKMFGGKAESVPGIGDDALYGAFNVLYVLKNDVVLTITPPNLQQAAQFEEHNKMMSMPLGSDEQRAAIEKMAQGMKTDTATRALAAPDAMSGAVDLIRHSANESGNEYETKSRLMARQLAEKVLSKMGS